MSENEIQHLAGEGDTRFSVRDNNHEFIIQYHPNTLCLSLKFTDHSLVVGQGVYAETYTRRIVLMPHSSDILLKFFGRLPKPQ